MVIFRLSEAFTRLITSPLVIRNVCPFNYLLYLDGFQLSLIHCNPCYINYSLLGLVCLSLVSYHKLFVNKAHVEART